MWWYIIISILIAVVLLTFAWRYKWNPLLVGIYCLLAIMSVFCGTWHNHFEPLHYNHVLLVSIKDENILRSKITDYKRNDMGIFSSWHPFRHSHLVDTRNTARDKMNDLKQFKAPSNVTSRTRKVKAQHATIRGIQYQLNRYNKLEKKLSN